MTKTPNQTSPVLILRSTDLRLASVYQSSSSESIVCYYLDTVITQRWVITSDIEEGMARSPYNLGIEQDHL